MWKVNKRIPFEEVLELLKEYKEEYGDCNVSVRYKTASGIPLGEIVGNIRYGNRNTTIEEKAKLDAIGFSWNSRNKTIKI